jgi:DNA recombination protein RmuC
MSGLFCDSLSGCAVLRHKTAPSPDPLCVILERHPKTQITFYMDILSISIGLLIGGIVAYIIFSLFNKTKSVPTTQFNELTTKYNEAISNLRGFEERVINLQTTNSELNTKLNTKESDYSAILTKHTANETQLNVSLEKIQELTTSLQTEVGTNKKQQEEINLHKQKISELTATNNSVADNLNKQNLTNDKQTKQIEELSLKLTELTSQISTLTANNNSLTEKLGTQKTEIEELQKTAHTEFKNIANEILKEKAAEFTKTNNDNIETLLKPFKDDVTEFRKKVEEETKERFSLGDKVKDLIEQTNKVSLEANNLATALKGQTKKQGNWGEMILERILEFSGLTKDREYYTQHNIKDEDGNNLRPDVIVNLPDERVIVIDSKVSLNAYEKFSTTENEEEQKQYLAEHLSSIYKHIDDLSSKNYDSLQNSLDYTMMFVPIEPAFLVAVQSDQTLWNYAYSKKIILISPTNLIACLKIISDLWKREKQSRNNLEIVKRGELLYNKLVTFLTTFDEVGRHITKTQTVYNTAINQMKTGRGHLIGQAIKLKELGDFKSNQEIPASMLPLDFENETTEGETKLADE